MSFENLQNNFANATALVVDRTVTPPRVLGQAFVVSKSRAVTCASAIFNYVEAPWALAINFLHPGLVYGAKTITLHPEFDKNTARTNYVSQMAWPGEILPTQLNDLAVISLDSELQELQLEKVGQLHKALTLPFSTAGVEVSGPLRADELLPLIKQLVEAKKVALLTLFDSFNLPIGRIQFDNGQIVKVHFGDIVNELGFSELLYRKSAQAFALQTQASINWGELPNISVTAESLIGEGLRRASELPAMLSSLGGLDARYQKAVQELDFSTYNPETRPLVEALWQLLDGYATLDSLAQMLGIDTYLAVQGMKELSNFGVVSLLNRTSPFAGSGVLGSPLISHMDFDINPGDALLAFYLNPTSGAPTWRQGGFGGVASVLQPKNLLHTIPLPNNLRGALILKDYKLVGVHSGPILPKPGQAANLVHYQMMWIGALLDMTSKKLRASEDVDDTVSDPASSGLRGRSLEHEAIPASVKVDKFICSSCFATNTKPGACFNCGAVIEAPEPVPEPTDAMGKLTAKLDELKEKHGITRTHLVAGLVLLFTLPILGMAMLHKTGSGESTQPTTPVAVKPAPKVEHPSSPEAAQLAASCAGFPQTPPSGYWYEDTQSLTNSTKSFALKSTVHNQNVGFLVFDDASALQNLKSFTARPPLTGLTGEIFGEKIAEGTETLDRGAFNWYLGRYKGEGLEIIKDGVVWKPGPDDDAPPPADPALLARTIFLGSFAGKPPHGSILVVGKAMDLTKPYDYKSTIWLVEQMSKSPDSKAPSDAGNQETQDKSTGPVAYASDEEVDKFCTNIQEKLQSKYSLPSDIKDDIAKKKLKRPKVAVMLDIDTDGQLKKIEITDPGETEKVTNILVKDVNACVPYQNVPNTKEGVVTVVVTLKKDQIKVERQ